MSRFSGPQLAGATPLLSWVVRAIRPSPFFSSAALRRRKNPNTAPVAANLGPAGIKPTEAKKSSMAAV